MTAPIRFIMLGGFLGAGKTTTLARLAGSYMQQGRRVGIVTNDQAANLVDTNLLRSLGFAVEEVPGACFCCRFDTLIDRVAALEASQRPEVILAEPVGSCTDLVATVVQPLRDLYRRQFQIAPYAVLFKPSHGRKILQGTSRGGFSPKAEYIFRKQLEEADAIVLNRIDEMSPGEVDDLAALVTAHYPGTPLLRISAKTGEGFEALLEFLHQDGAFGQKILSIDYDTYAEGEAELGWLNSSIHLQAASAFAMDDVVLAVMHALRETLTQQGSEVAHLKTIATEEGGAFAVANLVSTQEPVTLSLPSHASVGEADLIVNARVAIDPQILDAEVRRIVDALRERFGYQATYRQTQSLRPGRPIPTHRYNTAR